MTDVSHIFFKQALAFAYFYIFFQSILGDFNKEQEAFVTSKNADAKDECPLPWDGAEDVESVKQQIISLSAVCI